MKNVGWVLVVLLQLGCLAAILGGRRSNDEETSTAEQIAALRTDIQGAVHQQRTLSLYLDELRTDLSALLRSGPAAPSGSAHGTSDSSTPPTADDPRAPAPSNPVGTQSEKVQIPAGTTFPEAFEAMALLKRTLQQLRLEQKEPAPYLAPLQQKVDELRTRMLRLGSDSLHWIHHEATRPPYDEERDPELISYLLRELVPALSAANPSGSYDLARDVMLNSTHSPKVRQDAAEAMKLIAPDLWVDQYIDLITKGTGRESGLRVHLLHAFVDSPDPKIVEICQSFLEEPRHPAALRTESVRVLAAQNSAKVDDLLHKTLFQDHTPEIRSAALAELAGRLDEDGQRNLLREVLSRDESEMHQSVRELAQKMLDQLEAR